MLPTWGLFVAINIASKGRFVQAKELDPTFEREDVEAEKAANVRRRSGRVEETRYEEK
jgi:hypothetical protein